jgi:hypothetical protein
MRLQKLLIGEIGVKRDGIRGEEIVEVEYNCSYFTS